MPQAPSWDPGQYLAFAGPRLRPALDLLARVPVAAPARVLDLGCGAGDVTRVMARRWPEADITGIDSSEAMLARAHDGRITWIHADLATWTPPEPAALVFSNSVLHWLDGHERLLLRLLGHVAPGGALAVQMPLSWHLPSHRLMREVLGSGGPGGAPLGTAALHARLAAPPVQPAADYHRMLARRTRTLDIWTTEYLQALTGDEPVFEWVKGAGLRPILDALQGEERERFVQRYRACLREAYPPDAGGVTLYPFPRLFIVAKV